MTIEASFVGRFQRAAASIIGALAATIVAVLPSYATTPVEPSRGPDQVGEPAIPIVTQPARDLPDWQLDPNLLGLEGKRREDYGFIPFDYPYTPKVDPLLSLNSSLRAPEPDGFSNLIHNYDGQSTGASPPDTVGDVGPNHFVQAVNLSGSTVRVIRKSDGVVLKTFTMQSLTTASPCNSGIGDPIVIYDRAADRWMISELPNSGGNVCVYVSTTADPTGSYNAYRFAVGGGTIDFPKYGVWPQNGGAGSYFFGSNSGSGGRHDVVALDRAKMLQGLPATFQKFSVPDLPNSGFQLVLPSNMQGPTPPPDGEPALFVRPYDDEAQVGASTPSTDLLNLWELRVDWATPANSSLTQQPSLAIGDYDMTLCGLGGIWNCMPQPNTSQKIDPIREPLHFPFVYRNFGSYQTLVGTFPEDVDGTDHSAMRWFELRKSGSGAWAVQQEGVVGGETGVHRSVGSISVDSSGNLAMAYTRTGTTAPYFPSIYYRGRLSTDPPGTMPQGEHVIVDATNSNTDNERWGDYSGIGVDPVDDCTFWYTSEYGGNGNTKIAAFKFDACGCNGGPAAPALNASAPKENLIELTWNDSSSSTASQYLVLRSLSAGGPYSQIATVADSSPGTVSAAGYRYRDTTVSGGKRYHYVIKVNDGLACTSSNSNEASALASGFCRLAPNFAGASGVLNPGLATCALTVQWNAATSNCTGGVVSYNVYRSATPGFTPSASNLVGLGLTTNSYSDSSALSNNVPAYYIVRAADSVNGFEDRNAVQVIGTPTGAISTSTSTDSFEGSLSGGGFDQAGWTRVVYSGIVDWVWSTEQKQGGAHSWKAVDAPASSNKALISPAFGVGPATTLKFFHTYQFQGSSMACADAGTLETSVDGTTWTVVADASFTSGGFNGICTGQNNAILGKRAWCGGTIGPFQEVNINLGSDPNLVGKTIRLRWNEGDNPSIGAVGWYVDSVTFSNTQVVATCTSGASCALPSATSGLQLPNRNTLTWSVGAGASRYDVTRGSTLNLLAADGFTATTTGCAANDLTVTTLTESLLPVAGDANWYLVRGANSCGVGSYNENSTSQQRLRDPGIAASPNACP